MEGGGVDTFILLLLAPTFEKTRNSFSENGGGFLLLLSKKP
jgi:hypothetical protein